MYLQSTTTNSNQKFLRYIFNLSRHESIIDMKNNMAKIPAIKRRRLPKQVPLGLNAHVAEMWGFRAKYKRVYTPS